MLFYERNNEDVASLQKNTHLDSRYYTLFACSEGIFRSKNVVKNLMTLWL